MRFLTLAVAASVAAGGSAWADTVTLTGTIRDFLDTHPDMESVIGGVQTGQLDAQLGIDGNPVFVGAAQSGFTSAANFDQWYNDVDGVNMAQSMSLTLTEGAPGILGFSSNSFFPIDGQLLGNQGRGHNYHFTLELHGIFSFQAGQSFTFTGDDDLWVYFGGKLGIDLGGVHGAASQTVTSAQLVALGLSEGVNYNLDIFFAERHTSESNFSIQTSFAVGPGPSEVPLPASLPLVLAGLGALGLVKRRRR